MKSICLGGECMQKRGFTLIELLIVVAIIAILAAIAVPNFLEAQTRSKVSRTKADIRSLATGLEAYAVEWNNYPTGCAIIGGVPQTPYVSRLMRLQPLTTPVAFLTSIFPDVFNNKDQAQTEVANGAPGQGRLIPESELRIVVYWSPFLLDVWSFSDTHINNTFAELPNEVRKKANWMLLSFGPDQIFDINAGAWPTTIHVYDPTNGTISRGDIIRSKQMSYD